MEVIFPLMNLMTFWNLPFVEMYFPLVAPQPDIAPTCVCQFIALYALNLDFTQFGGKYFIVAADCYSGFVMAVVTSNQSTDSMLQFLHPIGLSYVYPTTIGRITG